MKERPILFSAPMVRAILEGRKTQARRALKIQPIHCTELPFILFPQSKDEAIEQTGFIWPNAKEQILSLCPYGQPGDRLWVRETFRIIGEGPDDKLSMFRRDDVQYFADSDERYIGPYHPSIHMPRWASRINLEITGVRVERLNEISEADAEREGAVPILVPPDGGSCPHIEGFRSLWESINGAGSWMANPRVWVVEFKQIKETA